MTTESDLAELRGSVDRLGKQVETLSLALRTVNQLQTRQLEIESAARQATQTAKAVKEDVAENVIPKQTIEKRWKEEEKALKKLRNGARIAMSGALAALILGCVAAFIGYEVGHGQLQKVINQRLGICRTSNQQKIVAAEQTRKAFMPLAAVYNAERHPDRVIAFILNGLANSKPLLTDCTDSHSSAPAQSPTPVESSLTPASR